MKIGSMGKTISISSTVCYHCGEACLSTIIRFDDKDFCCSGCKSVYDILQQNQLCNYYNITQNPGISQQRVHFNTYYDFLDEVHNQEKLIFFKEGKQTHLKLSIPNMHCSSCIWLLEHLNSLQAGIISSRVTFLEKEIYIVYNHEEISLKEIVILLKKIGYEPHLSLDDLTKKQAKQLNRKTLYKIAIAGFCFGNIMMLSLPDYFSNGYFFNEPLLNNAFNYIALALSIPVLFYCATEFFVSSWQVLKQKQMNIDVPIALAIFIAFVMSVVQIVGYHRMGYLDSMSGIVFFMLLGRFFQNKTYNYLTFQKNLSSYLPIAVNKYENGVEKNIALADVNIGDEIVIRHQEIVPADGLLMQEHAWFDYSFVTGESNWVEKHQNEIIYAGAIQKNSSCLLRISKKPSQSYITQLWNSKQAEKYQTNKMLTTEKINIYFSFTVLILGILACAYWCFQGQYQIGFKALITVWIVACPCALLLSSTFTYGNLLHILAQNGMYIKNASVLEKIKKVDTLVFDKTGTITHSNKTNVEYIGQELSPRAWKEIYSLSYHSIHPLSKAIRKHINETESFEVHQFIAHEGQGIEGIIGDRKVKLGSQKWLNVTQSQANRFTKVYVSFDDEVMGYFEIKNEYRKDIFQVLKRLKSYFTLHLLSGDNDAERNHLKPIFDQEDSLHFNQLPEQKTAHIEALQQKGHTVMMIGDGLNDAKAFEQSDIGMAIIENENNFLPACDVILKVEQLGKIQSLLKYISQAKTILIVCFVISLVYNIIGLSFALQGKLTPVVAAILMPISTVSIVGTSFLLSRLFAKQHKLTT